MNFCRGKPVEFTPETVSICKMTNGSIVILGKVDLSARFYSFSFCFRIFLDYVSNTCKQRESIGTRSFSTLELQVPTTN